MTKRRVIPTLILGLAVLIASALPAAARQSELFDDVEVHYVVFNTMFLTPEIARQYGITRGRDRALLNVSVIGRDAEPQPAEVTASYSNLLGQRSVLPLEEVREANAVYYIGAFRYTDEDTLRFHIGVRTRTGSLHEVTFQQKMYLEPR
jgi:hypothetical protein